MKAHDDTAPGLSPGLRAEIDAWLSRYPEDRRQSALLAALRAAQHEHGHLEVAQMDAIAAYLGIPAVAVYEVASFYSMYTLKPVGKHTLAVCTNISCMLRGASEIVAHLEQRLGIKLGESTPDGRFYLKREEECLAGCCGAPMMQVDHVYHEHLTPQRVDQILDSLE
ncbi:NADH-quinone oxidoreductase subunit NuoE [Thiorhodospira sibirica]|uniref:NADH-quinone oxidoreductase subunit NuoE family protein n=1 Tax=Thiorhodospira sibirica TaxID=154347 RepID=UPI00022C5293|nr:NADH-quinone oxidoreductase subunit NuoE [Thiorhodospira sibirica]